jgi:hypothetical protein
MHFKRNQRAAEAMHWQLGEKEMARRAGVIPGPHITSNAYYRLRYACCFFRPNNWHVEQQRGCIRLSAPLAPSPSKLSKLKTQASVQRCGIDVAEFEEAEAAGETAVCV